ncbi:hypothetical protein SLS55_000126 [Diplodia seriata]|uniref:Uncharacterized protein n=1 Tax=Diplodia seriata TaxID=420778 RepID=A0ABR3CTF0_9PEZI
MAMKYSTATVFLLTSLTVAVPLYPLTAPPVKSVESIKGLNVVGRAVTTDGNGSDNSAGNGDGDGNSAGNGDSAGNDNSAGNGNEADGNSLLGDNNSLIGDINL